MAAAGNCSSVRVMGMMDLLWFHRAILFPEANISSLCNPGKNLINEIPELTAREELNSSTGSCPTPIASPAVEIEKMVEEEKDRTARVGYSGLITSTEIRKSRRSSSSSPTAYTRSRRKSSIEPSKSKRLQKSMSCRSFADLEMEEVRGFMDLGFVFKREHLSPRIVSIIPGLQKLAAGAAVKQDPRRQQEDEKEKNEEEEEEEEQGDDGNEEGEGGEEAATPPHVRPYLSEAWLIRRPDSPLLNLRVPPMASPASEMKRHLRHWARTVASVIEQES
ncbi:hypothetical protein SAY87_022672 [Trapa incisa]|uniref:Uncharacterized protein n=1 Tax=Trapa incisa TaxID=236973 RepID=A0AAN7Q4J1_9MYRT|nr:hypothetical protein SAY87_022672 [Trapa incisa]